VPLQNRFLRWLVVVRALASEALTDFPQKFKTQAKKLKS
jgi:hypothetical protein